MSKKNIPVDLLEEEANKILEDIVKYRKKLDDATKRLEEMYIVIGIKYCRNEQIKKGISFFDRVINMYYEDKNYRALMYKGVALSDYGSYEEALKYLDRAEKLCKSDPLIYLSKGSIYALKKNFGNAIDLLDKALEIEPNLKEAQKLKYKIISDIEKGIV